MSWNIVNRGIDFIYGGYFKLTMVDSGIKGRVIIALLLGIGLDCLG